MEKAMAVTGLAASGQAVAMPTGLELTRLTPTASWMSRIEEHRAWEILAQMRITLRVGVSLHRFTVRNLLALAEGQVFETLAPDTEDVPVKIGQVQMGWSEFEVVEQRMALRLTRLD